MSSVVATLETLQLLDYICSECGSYERMSYYSLTDPLSVQLLLWQRFVMITVRMSIMSLAAAEPFLSSHLLTRGMHSCYCIPSLSLTNT